MPYAYASHYALLRPLGSTYDDPRLCVKAILTGTRKEGELAGGQNERTLSARRAAAAGVDRDALSDVDAEDGLDHNRLDNSPTRRQLPSLSNPRAPQALAPFEVLHAGVFSEPGRRTWYSQDYDSHDRKGADDVCKKGNILRDWRALALAVSCKKGIFGRRRSHSTLQHATG